MSGMQENDMSRTEHLALKGNYVPIIGKNHAWLLRLLANLRDFALGVEMVNPNAKTKMIMIPNFFFRHFSLEKQVSYLQSHGVSLGSRVKEGRRIYVYMLRNLFVEVLFTNDNNGEAPENLMILKGLKNLNAHLEKEFRASF